MRTRTRTDSMADESLDVPWNEQNVEESPSAVQAGDDVSPDMPAPGPDAPLVSAGEAAENLQDAEKTPQAGIEAEQATDGAQLSILSTLPEENVASQPQADEKGLPAEATPSAVPPSTEETPSSVVALGDEAQPPLSEPGNQATEADAGLVPPAREKKSRRQENTSIIEADESLGSKLHRYREQANVSEEALSNKLKINRQFIEWLEAGDYNSILDTLKINYTYIRLNVKEILGELNVPKDEINEMEMQLETDLTALGRSLYSYSNELASSSSSQYDLQKRPISNRLAQLVILIVVLVGAAIIFLSFVVPYIQTLRGTAKTSFDFSTLIKPKQDSNTVLAIPQPASRKK